MYWTTIARSIIQIQATSEKLCLGSTICDMCAMWPRISNLNSDFPISKLFPWIIKLQKFTDRQTKGYNNSSLEQSDERAKDRLNSSTKNNLEVSDINNQI